MTREEAQNIIKGLHEQGLSYKYIANLFQLSLSTVYDLNRKKPKSSNVTAIKKIEEYLKENN